MLNGVAPLIVFAFPLSSGSTHAAISGIPVIGQAIANNVGLPIPVYLDKRLTGIYVDNESKAIDIETASFPRYEPITNKPLPAISYQRGTQSLITVNLIAKRDSIILNVLLGLCDLAFAKLNQFEYSISYLNGPTTIFNGLLHGFSATQGNDNDLMDIQIQINKPTGALIESPPFDLQLPRQTGAIPVRVS